MTKRRVVVTGLGVVSCFGNDVDVFFNNLMSGNSGVSLITKFCTESFPVKIAASINDFDSGDYIEKKQARRIDKFIAYAIVAGKKALEYGKIDHTALEKLDKKKCGIIIGSGMGGMDIFYNGSLTIHDKGPSRLTPFFIPYTITNMASGMLAIDLGFMGPNYSISTACATGNNSIIAAANHIKNNEADLMICGGSEAGVLPISLAGFCACKALSNRNDDPSKASRPYDKDRNGFVLGEGAGVIILEELEHAKKRGATIYAEYLGGGVSCDAYHMTEPRSDGEGVAECVWHALKNANISPDQINYINAHATSTLAGDMAEIRALKKIFTNPSAIAINSTKSMIGHGLGAAGGLEAVTTVKSIMEGKIHPTINLENPEPDIEFKISKHAQDIKIKAALSNSFGFGGHNATIILGPYNE